MGVKGLSLTLTRCGSSLPLSLGPMTGAGARTRMGPWGWSHVGVARGLRGGCCALLVGVLLCVGAPPAGASVWRVQRLKPTNETLNSVSCRSKRSCMAVGLMFPKGTTGVIRRAKPLAESWDGSHWSLLATVNVPGSRDTELNGVSCSSKTACTAVGFWTRHGNHLPLAERWNGMSWSVQRMHALPLDDVPRAVSCATARVCMAVGDGPADRWNGTKWSLVRMPQRGLSLDGVSCVSARVCTAVGGAEDNGAVALKWNGTRWQTTLAYDNDSEDDLDAVSCVSLSFCIAAGSAADSDGVFGIWARWNGTRWSVPEDVEGGTFEGVSCTSSEACSAVGRSFSGAIYAERWNGSRWRVDPTRESRRSDLVAVSCTRGGFCVALPFLDGLTEIRS